MSEQLNTILERFRTKLSYRDQDKKALDISRAAAAGSLGDKNYSEWALINNDPLVVANYVKTFITTLASKLSAAPFRPADDKLNELVLEMRLNSIITELYQSTLADGYSFLGLGLDNGRPTASIIDARSILFDGDDPTLKDSSEVVVFEVLPREASDQFISTFPAGYVEYDDLAEKVKTHYYHKVDGKVILEVYEEGVADVQTVEVPNVDRIPVVRFYGERFELMDKRWHYRGLYYQLAGIIKATALAATKIQNRVAMSDDDNYIASNAAISNYPHSWGNSGVKEYDPINGNGEIIKDAIIPIQHDNGFLIQAFNTWKNITSDMLGPVVQSGSEAITREEVLARSEVRDAIANTYLNNVANSLAEVYRVINMLLTGNNMPVVVQGGFVESQKRSKQLQEIGMLYNTAKESGLNAQGFILEMLANSELPIAMKQRIGQILLQDPYASPKVVELNQQLQKAQQIIQQQTNQITQLRIMASQRMERQAEWVAAQERIKRYELMFKQWQQENKDTQEARMAVLQQLLSQGDTLGAMAMLQAIREIDTPVIMQPSTQMAMNQASNQVLNNYSEDLINVASNPNGVISNPVGPQRPAGTAGPTVGMALPSLPPARPFGH